MNIKAIGVVIGLFTIGLSVGAAEQATAASIVNSYGLLNPENTVTFSESSFAPGTLITNQFQSFGVTLTPGHIYNHQGNPGFPGISGDLVGNSQGVPFSIRFNNPVTSAAFGYAKNPTTVLVEALFNGSVIESFSQAVTYDNPNTAFLGFTNILFNEIRVTANAQEGLLDNIQFSNPATEIPTPALLPGLIGMGIATLRKRKGEAAETSA